MIKMDGYFEKGVYHDPVIISEYVDELNRISQRVISPGQKRLEV
jgi:hypothetical protein